MSDTEPVIQVNNDLQSLTSRGSGAANIAMVLRREIIDGRYSYGDRLPAERNLAVYFGASRGTVREALRRLEEDQLVVRRIGSGTFVQYRQRSDHEDIADATSPLELIEVRFAIEPHMVRLAVTNASRRDLDKLRDALERVEAAGSEPDAFSRADEEFHLTLAQCSKNPVMQWLYRHINDVRGHAQWSARKDKILTHERIRAYNVQHRRLFNAVHSRDIEGAVNEMTSHLERARNDLVGGNKDSAQGQSSR
jgi:DNA-binding FadR family transcriptional regulator